MKIYNQNKTEILHKAALDMGFGYLAPDKIFVARHEAVIGKTAEQIAQELIAQGEVCNLRFDGKWYRQTKVCEGGGMEEEPIESIEAQEAYDEYEDIQVFIPFTEEELRERKLSRLREERKPLLEAFDKWEKAVLRGRAEDDEAIMAWYRDVLDLKAEAFENVPEAVRYYL